MESVESKCSRFNQNPENESSGPTVSLYLMFKSFLYFSKNVLAFGFY